MSERVPDEQCPGCGFDLPETTPDDEGSWWVKDGQDLGCGCAGGWSADGENTAFPNHADDDCILCRDADIERLEAEIKLMRVNENWIDGRRVIPQHDAMAFMESLRGVDFELCRQDTGDASPAPQCRWAAAIVKWPGHNTHWHYGNTPAAAIAALAAACEEKP